MGSNKRYYAKPQPRSVATVARLGRAGEARRRK